MDKRLYRPLAALALLCGLGTPPSWADSPTVGGSQDPCTYLKKSSIPISVAASGTTLAGPALAAGQTVYVCAATLTIGSSATSAATAQFIGGTGAVCGTPTGNLTGALGAEVATANLPVAVTLGDGGATVFAAPVSNAVCLVAAGTTVAIAGVVSYVQTAN